MRFSALLLLFLICAVPNAIAQAQSKPPVIYAPPVTPDETKPAAPPATSVSTTTMPVNPAEVDIKITEMLVTTKGKPFVLPKLPAAGLSRDDLALIKAAANRAPFPVAATTIGEADAPDGGVGNSGRTESAPVGFITFPDGHQGYNAVASERTTSLYLAPKVLKSGLLQVELRLAFSETTVSAKSVKSRPRAFHPPVAVLITAHPGDTVLIGPSESSKPAVRLLFATVSVLPPTKE